MPGSSGRHFARLVDQNFLYNQTNAPAFAAYFAQTDSVQNYNSLRSATPAATCGTTSGTASSIPMQKSLDQVSNGDYADSSANQTNPANNASEYGPSDYDLKHRVVATGLYQTPTLHTHSEVVSMLVSGFQINGTYTYHTGFPWTPVTSNLNTVPIQNGAATQNVVRPLAYNGGAGNNCSNNAFETEVNFSKGGPAYFVTSLQFPTQVYKPGIGRNSFRGRCFQGMDVKLRHKSSAHDFGDRHTLLRLQANMFNIFNELQLAPIGNNTSPGSNINESYFGYSATADQGRAIELLARFQF